MILLFFLPDRPLFLLAFIGVASFWSFLLSIFDHFWGLCCVPEAVAKISDIGTQAARLVLEGTYLSMGTNVLAFQQISAERSLGEDCTCRFSGFQALSVLSFGFPLSPGGYFLHWFIVLWWFFDVFCLILIIDIDCFLFVCHVFAMKASLEGRL